MTQSAMSLKIKKINKNDIFHQEEGTCLSEWIHEIYLLVLIFKVLFPDFVWKVCRKV